MATSARVPGKSGVSTSPGNSGSGAGHSLQKGTSQRYNHLYSRAFTKTDAAFLEDASILAAKDFYLTGAQLLWQDGLILPRACNEHHDMLSLFMVSWWGLLWPRYIQLDLTFLVTRTA